MPVAPLIGFPTQIEVTCGPAWKGVIPNNGIPIQPDDVIVLTQIDGRNWTENGTDVIPDPDTNRLRLSFDGNKTGITLQASARVYAATYTSAIAHPILSFYSLGAADHSTIVGPGGGYNFLSIWSAASPNNYWRATWLNTPAAYNSDIFSLIREFVSDSGSGSRNRLLLGVG